MPFDFHNPSTPNDKKANLLKNSKYLNKHSSTPSRHQIIQENKFPGPLSLFPSFTQKPAGSYSLDNLKKQVFVFTYFNLFSMKNQYLFRYFTFMKTKQNVIDIRYQSHLQGFFNKFGFKKFCIYSSGSTALSVVLEIAVIAPSVVG